MIMRPIYSVIVGLCVMVGIGYAQEISLSLTQLDQAQEALDCFLPESLILNTLTYESDIFFDEAEFNYLVDLHPGQSVSAHDLKTALTMVSKKNKFKTVHLRLDKNQRGAAGIHLKFESFWTFAKVIVKGINTGKDQYVHLYLLEPGEFFDYQKHRHSLERLKEALYHQGYLNARVYDVLYYDHKTKSITVTLTLKRDCLFTIHDVRCSLPADAPPELYALVDKKFTHKVVNKIYNAQELNRHGKDLKAGLYKKGFFQAQIALKELVACEDAQVTLLLDLVPGQRKKFMFNGAHFFSSSQLIDALLALGQTVILVPPQLLAEEVKRFYYKKGFWKAQVTVEEHADRMLFCIIEGPRMTVNDVQFKGMEHGLFSLLTTYFQALLDHHFFDADLLKQALEQVTSWYQRQGFWDASVISYDFVLQSSSVTDHQLIVHFNEGIQRFLSHVSIPGWPAYEQENVFNLINQAIVPMPFDLNQLSVQRQWLLSRLHAQGYWNAELKLVIEGTERLNLIWYINAHERVCFGKTIIQGTSSLSYVHIMRELSFPPGAAWESQTLEQALMRLRDLEIFESVSINPDHDFKYKDCTPLLVKLIEDDPYEIRLRAGLLGVSKNLTWRDGATYKFGGSCVYKNPFKYGDQFRFDIDLTRFERYISGYYRIPWIFGYPLKTIFKGYSNWYTQPVVIGTKEPLYIALQHGFLINVTHRAKQIVAGITSGITLGFEWMETELKSVTAARAINFSPSLLDHKVPYVFVEPSVVIDHLDDKINPCLGYFTVLSCKGMFPLTTTRSLFKILAEQSVFYPLYKNLIGALRVKIGHIFNRQFNQIMPPERFYLGGPNSIRGYNPDFAPPLGCLVEGSRNQLVPQGGKTVVNINIELRFPIFRKIAGAVFQDVGALFGDDLVARLKDGWVAASGAGIRYNTPIGPLRFDVGCKWKKFYEKDSRFAWYLTLGHAF
jgi:outer membrane protein insertion porin family